MKLKKLKGLKILLLGVLVAFIGGFIHESVYDLGYGVGIVGFFIAVYGFAVHSIQWYKNMTANPAIEDKKSDHPWE